MRILFLPKSPDATRVYRVDIPSKYLQRAGHEVRIRYPEPVKSFESETLNVEDVAWADVVVWQRPATARAFDMLQHMKAVYPSKPMLGDYDDDYSSVPRWNPGYAFIQMNVKSWPKFFPEFDGIIASTDPLAEKLGMFAPQADVVTIKNGFDFEEFDAIEPNASAGLFVPKMDGERVVAEASVDVATFNEMMRDKLVVAWAGSRFHYVDLDLLPEDLLDVAKKRDDIVFLFVGYAQGKLIDAIPKNRLYLTGGRAPISEFYRLLKTLKIDAMLAPVDACEFNKSKCVTGSTLVPTSRGIFRIDKIVDNIGDDIVRPILGVEVYTSNGLKSVAAGFYKRKTKVITITTSDGYRISGTPDHRVLSGDGSWVSLGSMSIGSSVLLSGFGFSENYVDITYPYVAGRTEKGWGGHPSMLPKIRINERWGRLFGLLIGDGCIRGKNRISVSGSTDYPDVLDDAESLLRDIGLHPIRVRKKDKRQAKESKGIDVVASSTHFIEWCRTLGVIGSKGESGKVFRIPDFILRSPKTVVREFLVGLFESDACVAANTITFCTKSIDLARDVQFILLGFGIRSKVIQRWNKKYKKNYHYVVLGSKSLRIYYGAIGFASKKKSEKLREQAMKAPSNAQVDWSLSDSVETIEHGTDDVFDLTVPGCSEFVGNGFVNHNSNLKVIEAMACNAYPICSDWHPYCDDLDVGSGHGSLVWYESGDWAKKILVWANSRSGHAIEHKSMMEENQAYVRSTHHARLRTEEYLRFFERMAVRKL